MRKLQPVVLVLVLAAATLAAQSRELFAPAARCRACHDGLVSPSGVDVSFGFDWEATMMAHAARDPYWLASVRRETVDHPSAAAAIEDECSRCHMPMSHVTETADGGRARVFGHAAATPLGRLAGEGVSCTACHQVTGARLGTAESFGGHFVVETDALVRLAFGPWDVDDGRTRVMESATGFRPTRGPHVRSAEFCASCHTLFTHAVGAGGLALPPLPEQVPYLEWKHGGWADVATCTSCHMPSVDEPTRISSVLGQPRDGVSAHTFRGGNAWMLRLLDGAADELGVVASPEEMDRAADDTTDFLRSAAALSLDRVRREPAGLTFEVVVDSLAGHKVPTGYPSRRAWLHVSVRDASGSVVFESGAVEPDGRIAGNDNDADPGRYEPHHVEIGSGDQVQVYESILVDRAGAVTTGLLSAVRHVKDNRLLPGGFDKAAAGPEIAVHGSAAGDPDFTEGGDRVRYVVSAPPSGPLTIEAELLYQPVGYRWATALAAVASAETRLFTRLQQRACEARTVQMAHVAAAVPAAVSGGE